MEAGGLYVNGVAIKAANEKVDKAHFLQKKMMVLRAGKDKHMIVAIA